MNRHLIICYDIKEDRDRKDLIELLFYFHLVRVQYRVFMGTVTDGEYGRLTARMRAEITKESVKILVLEICNQCMERAILIHEVIPTHRDDFEII